MDSRGRGSFSFWRRITSVLSPKMLELNTHRHTRKWNHRISERGNEQWPTLLSGDQTYRSAISLSSAWGKKFCPSVRMCLIRSSSMNEAQQFRLQFSHSTGWDYDPKLMTSVNWLWLEKLKHLICTTCSAPRLQLPEEVKCLFRWSVPSSSSGLKVMSTPRCRLPWPLFSLSSPAPWPAPPTTDTSLSRSGQSLSSSSSSAQLSALKKQQEKLCDVTTANDSVTVKGFQSLVIISPKIKSTIPRRSLRCCKIDVCLVAL